MPRTRRAIAAPSTPGDHVLPCTRVLCTSPTRDTVEVLAMCTPGGSVTLTLPLETARELLADLSLTLRTRDWLDAQP